MTKRWLFLSMVALLVCSLVLNWEQLRRSESYRADTLNQVMLDFSGPIIGISKGFKMSTPSATRAYEAQLLSQSVGALIAGTPTLDSLGIHQYSYGIFTENQFAIAALNGRFSTTQQNELAKWADQEGAFLNQYETQKSLPNIPLLKETFKEIYGAMPMSTS